MLHVTTAGSGPTLTLVHGFTQTGRSWAPLAPTLGRGRRTCVVDLPGHGRSDHDDADLWEAARLVGEAGGPGDYLGYSLGARVLLHLALSTSAVVDRLVLLGGTAGIEDDAERVERRRSDEALAASIERDGVDVFLERWLAQPMFARLPPAVADLDDRRTNRAEGLAASLRRCGTATMDPPLWNRLATLDLPVLVVAGERDEKFAALGRRLAAAIGPTAEVALVPGAGHAAHLERPDAFAAVVGPFLAR